MGLLCGEGCVILTSTVFDWSTRVTDRRTDGQTDRQTDRRSGDGKERAIAYMLSRANNSNCKYSKTLQFSLTKCNGFTRNLKTHSNIPCFFLLFCLVCSLAYVGYKTLGFVPWLQCHRQLQLVSRPLYMYSFLKVIVYTSPGLRYDKPCSTDARAMKPINTILKNHSMSNDSSFHSVMTKWRWKWCPVTTSFSGV